MLIPIALALAASNFPLRDDEFVRLQTSFKIEGTLEVKKRWTFLNAIWGNKGLYLVQPGEIRPVNGFDKLRCHVRIESTEAALNYVRLATSPTTAYCFGEGEFEIITRDALDASFVYGNERILQYMRAVRDGAYGVVPKKYLLELKLHGARTLKLGGQFFVRRWLVTGRVPSSLCSEVLETVAADGSYSRSTLEKRILNRIYIPPGGA